MGFWDVGIGDLEAIGVRVSPEQEHVLQEGGEVLFIKGLFSLYHWYGDATGILDQFDQQVYVPQTLRRLPAMAVRLRTSSAQRIPTNDATQSAFAPRH